MKIVVPAAGRSSRFPNMRPKWLLTHPNGRLMITECLTGFNMSNIEEINIIVLSKHLEQYSCKDSLIKELSETFNVKINLIELSSETKSQSETIYQGIKQANISGNIFIKDCDNKFSTEIKEGNYVSYVNINNFNIKNLLNKSYLILNKEKNLIESINEKQIVSNYLCISGYSFENSYDFLKSYEQICSFESEKEIYVSHVINNLILNNSKTFNSNEAHNFIDWGTLDDWQDYLEKYATYFVDIDGVLFENASKHFLPEWGKSSPIKENIEVIRDLYNSNTCEIILTTSRSLEFKNSTIEQLKEYDIKYHNIIFGLQHNKRIIINDFSNTNKYPSCSAINIERNSCNLKKFIKNI
jgi:hypothetical protein